MTKVTRESMKEDIKKQEKEVIDEILELFEWDSDEQEVEFKNYLTNNSMTGYLEPGVINPHAKITQLTSLKNAMKKRMNVVSFSDTSGKKANRVGSSLYKLSVE